MPKLKQIPLQAAIAFDQLLNTLCGGWADETFSARCWRLKHVTKGWLLAYKTVNNIFFWQKDHCRRAYLGEIERQDLPTEMR